MTRSPQLFSSLYSMLPSAKKYLWRAGLSLPAAGYASIACFLGGVISIQVISRFLHRYIPSHVVDCDHSHKGGVSENDSDSPVEVMQDHSHSHSYESNGRISETSPLLSQENSKALTSGHRPKLQPHSKNRVSTIVHGKKPTCNEEGLCHGYSGLCAPECFEGIIKSPARITRRFSTSGSLRRPLMPRSLTASDSEAVHKSLMSHDIESGSLSPKSNMESEDQVQPNYQSRGDHQNHALSRSTPMDLPASLKNNHNKTHGDSPHSTSHDMNHLSPTHHHHVPTNAFLAIGLQTSIAIALHKLPEGFITFTTNHANPKLGFSVFMALFIHNITEGFAMALPLYLALGSRWKSMIWSSLLGGISQPLGAAVAALWFKAAGKSDMAPGDAAYGCIFAVTAGIMASVALQIFSESLGLTHNRNLCIAFAFIGMGILGLSSALTAS